MESNNERFVIALVGVFAQNKEEFNGGGLCKKKKQTTPTEKLNW